MTPPVSAGAHARGLRLDELAREIPGRVDVRGDGSVRVLGVRHDSRAIEPGELFVARKGRTDDGTRFVTDAVARGAAAVLAARGVLQGSELTVPVVEVDDAAAGLAYAASAVYGQPSFSLDVVGITGHQRQDDHRATSFARPSMARWGSRRAASSVRSATGSGRGAWRPSTRRPRPTISHARWTRCARAGPPTSRWRCRRTPSSSGGCWPSGSASPRSRT